MSTPATGVVVMSYGTPSGPEDVEAFYTDVRRGRPPSDEQLADLQRRYGAIGGVSPLAARTRSQVDAIQRALDAIAPEQYRAALATKHSHPRIEDAVSQLAALGTKRVVGLVLAPHYSSLSVGEYAARLQQSAADHEMDSTCIRSWATMPALVEVLAERVEAALGSLAQMLRPDDPVEVLFTAHSLPARIRQMGDPYEQELTDTARAVAAVVKLGEPGRPAYRTGWQSAGRTGEPWLGPDLLDSVRQRAEDGIKGLVVCPAGFTSDHLEVLYDVDIDAARVADGCGVALVRTASLNDEPRVCEGLARLVVEAWPELAGAVS